MNELFICGYIYVVWWLFRNLTLIYNLQLFLADEWFMDATLLLLLQVVFLDCTPTLSIKVSHGVSLPQPRIWWKFSVSLGSPKKDDCLKIVMDNIFKKQIAIFCFRIKLRASAFLFSNVVMQRFIYYEKRHRCKNSVDDQQQSLPRTELSLLPAAK